MAKDYSKPFYDSKAWQQLRMEILKEKHYLCERCMKEGIYKPAIEVHHKIHITPENINDPSITLNKDNLECLCHECHTKEHIKKNEKRYCIDELGNVQL